jgi:hypothetical protein
MIRKNEGCLACGERVEPVVVDKNGVRPTKRDPVEDGSGG